MAGDGSDTAAAPTRRDTIKYGGAVLGGGLLAGCAGGDSGSTPTEAPAGTDAAPTDTGGADASTPTATDAPTETATAADTSYTVSMVPVGDVEFDSVPETWVANNGSWADMGIALGLEPPKGVWLTSRYHTKFYDPIPGVSVDTSDMVSLWSDSLSKEVFFELDADVHVMDPNFVLNRFKGWEREDVADVEETVAPLFGNSIYTRHFPWHADYRYYSLYEAFGKLAAVFQRTDRYRAFTEIHDEFRQNLAPVVPSRGERPEVAVLWGVGDEPEEFFPYIIDEGTGFTHLTSLGVRDALAASDIKDFYGTRAAIDLETLLEVDPEVIMLRAYESKTREEFQDTVVDFLKNHATASALTAVQNGDVYRAGGLYQGPITSMVLTERTAGQLYDFEGDLFDHERVGDVVNGTL